MQVYEWKIKAFSSRIKIKERAGGKRRRGEGDEKEKERRIEKGWKSGSASWGIKPKGGS